MPIAMIHTRAMVGIEAPQVLVEVDLSLGLPGFSIVGLPEAAVRESKDRVRSAILNSNYEFPDGKIVVNLAPADLPKHGSRFDLAIAVGVLVASGQMNAAAITQMEFIGELALTGQVRAVKGVLPFALYTKAAGRILVLPENNLADIAIIEQIKLIPIDSLVSLGQFINQTEPTYQVQERQAPTAITYAVDYAEVKGQTHAKKALEIAAAGGHNVLMVGSPGSGKTMLASRLITIMPDLNYNEALEVAAIYSLSDKQQEHLMQRPFRMPHHTSSDIALIGGGRPPKPGEVSLAHKGVLFLDELPEFGRHALETLRQPIESRKVYIARAGWQSEFPADFQLITAMNPCPCGYHADTQKSCRCTVEQIRRYQHKISGPLLERIDLHVEVNSLEQSEWFNPQANETSAMIKERVQAAIALQMQRQAKYNYALTPLEIKTHCQLTASTQEILEQAIAKFRLSMRTIHRLLKVTRTIADLSSSPTIDQTHLTQALGFRATWQCM